MSRWPVTWGRRARTAVARWAVASILGGVFTLLPADLALHLVPLPPDLFEDPAGSLSIVDRHGRTLRDTLDDTAQFAMPTPFGHVPSTFSAATIAAEDRRFFDHRGIDWMANLRAVRDLVRYRRVTSGASTITQQLIKLSSDPHPRTLTTKLWQTLQAIRLEQVWDKQHILQAYWQRLEYGQLCRGPAAAAAFYFGKPLTDLTVAESALLAGLPQAPSRLNPIRYPERARRRQESVLRQMRRSGAITAIELVRACDEPLQISPHLRAFRAPHFVEYILNQAPIRLRSGNRLETTLDLELNTFVQQAIARNVRQLRARHVLNGAAVVLDNASGDILAYVGSQDYWSADAGQVDGAQALRSAGSTLKPFTYLLALERGATPATLLADVPIEFQTPAGIYSPVNYSRHCSGPVRLRAALANSLNIPAVRLLSEIGGAQVLQRRLQEAGINSLVPEPEHYGLGLTLGNAEVRLLELANAYASLARLGIFKPLRAVRAEMPWTMCPQPDRRVCQPEASYLIADILDDDHARSQAFGYQSDLRFDFPVACKTGTSTDFRDNWVVGYTPEFTVAVWIGNSDGTPMDDISGITGAGPIFHDIFEHLHARYGTTWYPRPASIVTVPVHAITGKRAVVSTSPVLPEKFSSRHLPPPEVATDYDELGRIRLASEYGPWITSADNWLGNQVTLDDDHQHLRVVRPLPGTIFYLDDDLRDEAGQVLLCADGPGDLVWASETLVCRNEAGRSLVRLREGRHRLTVRSAAANQTQETWITVKRL